MHQIAEHDCKLHKFELVKGAIQGLCRKIEWAVDEQYLQWLKQPMVG